MQYIQFSELSRHNVSVITCEDVLTTAFSGIWERRKEITIRTWSVLTLAVRCAWLQESSSLQMASPPVEARLAKVSFVALMRWTFYNGLCFNGLQGRADIKGKSIILFLMAVWRLSMLGYWSFELCGGNVSWANLSLA